MFNIKCVLLIIPTNQEDINVHLSSCEVPVILVSFFFIKLEFSLQIFEKNHKYHIRKNTSNVRRVTCGQTNGGHDEVNSRFPQICKRA